MVTPATGKGLLGGGGSGGGGGKQLLPSLAQQFSFDGFKASHDVPERVNCASAGRGRRDQRGEVARDEAGRARR